ncbi:MAG: TraR/DksA family transcriptional regulator [Betaproteobacteria bacterium]
MALTSKQSEELRKRVEKRRAELIAELREDAARARDEPYSEHAGIAPDTGDESVATLIADLDQADLTRDLDELRAMDAAWQRIKDGTYGVCVDCGGEVGYERLKANPAASRDIHCQERHEKTYGGTPKPSL